jgi:tetratricopeptide (TPR) repeat protein
MKPFFRPLGLALLLLCSGRAFLFSLDLSLRLRPFMFFPVGRSAEYFGPGGGGDLGLDFDITGILPNSLGLGYSLGIEAAFGIDLLAGNSGMPLLFSGGGTAGIFWYPLSRLNLRGEAGLGYYQWSLDGGGTSSLWWRAGGEAGFRFNPRFTLSAAGGYRYYLNPRGGVLLSGPYAGISAQINFETRASSGSVDVEVLQDQRIMPVFLSLYRANPAASLRIINRETAEIRDIKVSFRAAGYSSSEYPCGELPRLGKGRSAELPLYADFSQDLFAFTGDSRIIGEVRIRYSLLGSEKTVTRSAPVEVYNRNAFRWADSRGIAAFVNPTAPETLGFSKSAAGLARRRFREGINRNLQFALWFLEALRAAGIRLGGPMDTPYSAYHLPGGDGAFPLDSVQFPFQTLSFRNGGPDDLGLLYAALLEGTGIASAFIPLEDEFILLCSLGLSEKAAESNFNGLGRLLVVDDETWIPLGLSAFNDGFTAAWNAGAERLDRVFTGEGGEEALFILTRDAWRTYPPAVLPGQKLEVPGIDEALAEKAAAEALDDYVGRELRPKIAALKERINRGESSPALYNQLGLLSIRLGMNDEALPYFTRAASGGSLSAMVNLGNIHLRSGNYGEAAAWFARVLEADPSNSAALKGQNQVRAANPGAGAPERPGLR